MFYRHGDLSFHPKTRKPTNIKEVKHEGSFVLALGEATGHKHVITAPKKAMRIFKDAEGRLVLELKEAATVTHEEHKPITIEPGVYVQENEREYDWFAETVQRVID